MADALGQAATQAPQPMHWAASMASSALSWGTGMALASGCPAGIDGNETAGLNDAVQGTAVDHQVFDDLEGHGAERFNGDYIAVFEMPHVQLAQGGAFQRAVGPPLITAPHMPQMPSRQSWSKAIGSLPSASAVR
jgi:hypothetical protein